MKQYNNLNLNLQKLKVKDVKSGLKYDVTVIRRELNFNLD
jgi:hypothetical protein